MTGSGDRTLWLKLEPGCACSFTVPLYCEPHGYKHLWGWACSTCWRQAFYEPLECGEGD